MYDDNFSAQNIDSIPMEEWEKTGWKGDRNRKSADHMFVPFVSLLENIHKQITDTMETI